jgi:acetoacetyl-CoA synthetase
MLETANGTPAASEGDRLWTPSATFVEKAQLTKFFRWLATTRGLHFENYEALWRWSVHDLSSFWAAIWGYFGVISDTPYDRVLSENAMPGVKWFEGSRTNYAEHVLRFEALAEPNRVAFYHCTETRQLAHMSWQELGAQVRKVATRLRELGVRPGDRVASYMPNVPETAVAMLAATAVGAIWSAAAPEFGAKTVIDRFGQIAPKLLFAADGYTFGGKLYDRREQIAHIVERLPSIEAVVWLPYLGLERQPSAVQTLVFADLIAGPAIAREDFRYERVPFDHPLWILFSSGTTGLPKAIVHSHIGIIAEHLKALTLNCNLGPDSTMFFYSTTGWMMWNSVISALITGASAVLYDGSPVHGGTDMLWRLAQDARVTIFGASPSLVQNMKKAGVRPAERFDLSRLEMVLVGGAPSTPEIFEWFYANVKPDLLVGSQSGGTELCSALVTSVATSPVYAGEIQGRALGMDVHAWDGNGLDLIDEIGELVMVKPAPSMPLYFWSDRNNQRYIDSYFGVFAGVWRHGDLLKVNARGGCYIYGRSDSTLNRFGVRIGSAEIYRVLAQVKGVKDSLIICCETRGGGFYMPLFVALEDGTALSESLIAAIMARLRHDASPRHVPDTIVLAPAVPYTLTGKKMEVPIRNIVMGLDPAKVVSRDAMANPEVLDWYVQFAKRPEVVAIRGDVG